MEGHVTHRHRQTEEGMGGVAIQQQDHTHNNHTPYTRCYPTVCGHWVCQHYNVSFVGVDDSLLVSKLAVSKFTHLGIYTGIGSCMREVGMGGAIVTVVS